MRFKTYLRTLAAIVTALVALKVGLSVVIDPYDAFGAVGFVQRNFEPNTRIAKIRFLSERCGDFDSYVLGTSRVNYYNVADASKSLGGRFYNFNVSAETMGGVRAKLEWLAANCTVDRVLIGLDFDWFHSDEFHGGDLLRREHPAANGSGFREFAGVKAPKLFEYIRVFAPYLNIPVKTLRRAVRAQFRGPLRFRVDLATGHALLFENGAPANQMRDRVVPDAAIPRVCFAPAPLDARKYQVNRDILAEIARLARANAIEAIFVVNPINENVAATFEAPAYAVFLRDAVRITGGIWYFGGFNVFTEDEARYVDASHFGRPTGAEVLRIIGGGAVAPAGLGFFGTADAERLYNLALANYAARGSACTASQTAPTAP